MYTQETKVYYLSMVGAIILTVFLLSFLLSLLAQYRKNRQLFKEKLLVEINTAEEERSRITADLHDDVGPLLSALRFQIESMHPALADPERQALSLVHVDQILERVGNISNELVPSSLASLGFIQAITEYCKGINSARKSTIRHSFAPLSLPADKEIHLYRIVHELINNALKHAGAGVIHVEGKISGKKITFEIVDNGRGFNFHAALRKGTGRGLKNVMNRLDLIGGKMHVSSCQDKGTSYLIELPFYPFINDDKNSIGG